MRGGRCNFGGLKTALRVQGGRALQDNAHLSEGRAQARRTHHKMRSISRSTVLQRGQNYSPS